MTDKDTKSDIFKQNSSNNYEPDKENVNPATEKDSTKPPQVPKVTRSANKRTNSAEAGKQKQTPTTHSNS